ncbi:hypothetical protein KCU62_g8988, partial [Aureobasidium sp. EXF-3399]
MILDKVDFSHIASAFKLRDYTYSGCNPASLSMPVGHKPDAAARERDIFERAKQRRRAEAEQARLKLAKKEARTRIRQFEDQRRMDDIDIRTPERSTDIAERDSDRLQVESQSQMVQSTPESQKHKLRKLERLTIRTTCANAARPTVSRHPNKNTRIVHKFSNECTAFRYFSLEAAFERLVVTAGSKKNPRLVD